MATLGSQGAKIQCIVPRMNDEESGFAVIDAIVKPHIKSDYELHAAVVKAVTSWVNETDDGKEAWNDSVADFNIGDLSQQDLSSDGSIYPYLKAQGILSIEIETFCSARCSSWGYDDILCQPEANEED